MLSDILQPTAPCLRYTVGGTAENYICICILGKKKQTLCFNRRTRVGCRKVHAALGHKQDPCHCREINTVDKKNNKGMRKEAVSVRQPDCGLDLEVIESH